MDLNDTSTTSLPLVPIQGSADSSLGGVAGVSLPAQVAMGVGLYSLALVTCVGNAMVIHAIRTEKRLRKVSNFFIMSLAFADLAVGVFVMPVSAVYALTNQWYFGIWLCEMWLSADYVASTASILNLFVLSLDRYWSITSPLKYLRRRTKKRAFLMIAAAWCLSCLWIFPVTSWHTMANEDGLRQQPSHVCDTEFAHNVTFKVTAAVANFYVPTLSMLYIYGRIFCTIRQRGRSNHLGQINTGSSSTRSWKLTSLRTHRASNTAHRVNSAGSKASVAGALPANPPAVQSAAAASAATSSAAAAAAKSKNCDDSSDTISINTEDQRSTKARHWRPRFNRIISATCGGKKKTGIRWYRRSGQSTGTLGRDRLFISSRSDGGSDCRVYDLYQSLTLLEIHNNHHNANKATATATSNGSSSVTHYVNVRVNVEYVAEDEPADQRAAEDNRIDVQQTISADEDDDVVEMTNVTENHRTGRQLKANAKSGSSTSTLTGLISQKEKKAARQLGVIMCAFIVCWLPYFIVFLVVAVCPNCINGTLYHVTLWLGYINSTLNPVLYPLCNANFRRAFAKMLTLKSCASNKHQTYPSTNPTNVVPCPPSRY